MRKRTAFTLVEMTIYTGLTAVLMIGLIRSMLIILEHDQVTSSRATVQQELRVVMDQILYDIREAESVNAASSVFDSDTGTLSLAFSGSTRNPTVYTLSLGTIRVRKSTESWMDITGAGIVIDQLKFEKKTFSNTTAAIGVTITGTDVYGSDGLFTEKSVTLREVATIRKQFAAYDPRVMYGSGFYSSTPDVLFGLPPTIYENCTNGSDDDSDSLIDCADTVDCPTGMSCGGGQTCQAGSCGIDTTPPSISTLSPTDDATGISTSTNLVITFSEAVDPEAGASNDIIIKKGSDGSIVETIDAQSAQVTGGGTATITINPASDLEASTMYYVQIGADAFDDAASNSFAGIGDSTTWNFTTVAGGGSWTLVFSEDFTDSNGSTLPSHNFVWEAVGLYPDITIYGNKAQGGYPSGGYAYEFLNISLNNDQAVEATIVEGNNDQTLLYLRSDASLENGYQVAWNGFIPDELILNEFTAGVGTTLDSTIVTWNPGDILRIEALGNQIRVLINGIEQLSVTDTFHSSGNAGIGIGAWTQQTIDDLKVYEQ